MNKYNALNAGYDQLYPQPMKHANTHAKDGSDPITPASIGVYTKTEADALLANKVEKKVILGSDTDLNNVLASGFYRLNGVSTNNVSGCTWGELIVASDGAVCIQIVSDHTGSIFAKRTCSNGSDWSDWKKLATTDYAVSKSGDTMTGALEISSAYYNSQLKIKRAASGDSVIGFYGPSAQRGALGFSVNDELICRFQDKSANADTKFVLHTGNAQSLGFTKIATGSYVGTGTAGSTNPNSLTFNFEPKIVFIMANQSNGFSPGTAFIRGQSWSGGLGETSIEPGKMQNAVSWSGNTVSWHALDSYESVKAQMNVSGATYFYCALG